MVDSGVQAHDRPAVLAGTVEWSARAVEPVAATPQRLAGLVEAALDRADRVLFTVTPREELDDAARWQRLADQAWCGQLRHVVAATSRLSGTDRDFAGDELALALSVSPMTGRSLVWEFGATAALPGLVEAVEAGRLTVRHVKAFMRTVDEVSLTLEQRQAIALIALARFGDQTPGEWTVLVRRLILTVDPKAAARRRDEKVAERRVRFYPQPDEQGGMWLQAPVEQVARAEARLHAEATRLKATGDPRSVDQIVCDVALALLADGTLAGQSAAPYEVHVLIPLSLLEGAGGADGESHADAEPVIAEIPGWGAISASTARELASQAAGFTQISLDEDGHVTSVGDRVPAESVPTESVLTESVLTESVPTETVLTESVPTESVPTESVPASRVPADQASQLFPVRPTSPDRAGDDRPDLSAPPDRFLARAAQAMRRPPVERDLSSSHYRPGTRLSRFVQARDRTCVFPGCQRPARRSDLDHRVPWPRGSTSADNLQCLCRHHHRAKHAVFTVLAGADGTVVWITRGRWVFRRRRQAC